MIKGKTTSGFEYKLSKDDLDNYELMEVLAEAEENGALLPKAFVMLLGKEQLEKLKKHLKNENGIVPFSKMTEEIMEIMQSQKETKNS